MKIIVNVAQKLMGENWLPLGTGGFRLVEQRDGSFDIHLTTDLADRLEIDRKLDEALLPHDFDGTMPSI